LKCYAHPDREAVAVCIVCKRGVCKSCEVIMGGRHYCKEHAEKHLVREGRSAVYQERGSAITIASILAVLGGVAGLVVGFLLLMIGLVGPAAANSPILFSTFAGLLDYFSAVTSYPADQTLLVGLAAFLFGSVGIAAGYYMWRRSKRAAILAAVAAFLGEALLVGGPEVLALAGAFTYVYAAATILSIFLIVYGWKHLK